MYEFRWNDWNLGHVAEHGVEPEEAEYVVNHARRPYPERSGKAKYLVRGHNAAGDHLQVIFVLDDDDRTAYVIHARPLTEAERRRFRRRR
jgi:uncharacterized DUF497 family protein